MKKKKIKDKKECLSVPEVAKLLDISHATLRRYIDEKKLLIPYIKRKRGEKMTEVVFDPKIVKKYIPKMWRKKDEI